MMKLATLSKSRDNICRQLLKRNVFTQEVFDSHPLMSFAGMSTTAQKGSPSDRAYGNASTVGHRSFNNARIYGGMSTVGQRGFTNDRIYAPYHVYKGKAALRAEPVPPKFSKLDSGGFKVARPGFILLSISPCIGERKYDWQRKQVFALSVTEVGSLIALGDGGSCEFFHDPALKSSNAGQVRKTLSIKSNPEANGYFVTLHVNNAVQKTNERLFLPLTSAELAVMRTSFSFALPYIMGWDLYSIQMPVFKEDNAIQVGQKSVNSEWDR